LGSRGAFWAQAGVAALDAAARMKDMDLIGRVLDTLVVAELRG